MPEPFAVVSVAEMRALEAAAMDAGTPERVLQERAGLAVADVIEAELSAIRAGNHRPARVVSLAGAGNNGRDAVVAGRRLSARGCGVHIWWGSRCPLTEQEIADLAAEGIHLHRFDGAGAIRQLERSLEGTDFVVDGLLGVGSRGPMRPEFAAVAEAVNAAATRNRSLRVIAVDVPSGIDADTGEVPGTVVRADVTVTFGAVKAGLLRFPAGGHTGRLVIARIGLPAGRARAYPFPVLDEAVVCALVPRRLMNAHKYTVGRVLAIAGSDEYVGAACLGSEAAARAGAGLVGLVSTEAVKRVLATRLPEATYPLTLTELDDAPEAAADAVASLLPEQSALLIGPGIGRSEAIERFLRYVLARNARLERSTPAVIDADALSLLAGWPGWWDQIGPGNVLTPHGGEMARLLGSDPSLGTVAGEAPWETARRAAARWQQVVVLKGPFTVVAEPDGPAWVYPHANPALATAGTGDVLAGLTAGLIAQGLSPAAAARLAVVVHALAAGRATSRRGSRLLLASDLPREISGILADLPDRST